MKSWPAALIAEFCLSAAVIAVQVFTSPHAARVWSHGTALEVTHLCEHQSLATGLVAFVAMAAVSVLFSLFFNLELVNDEAYDFIL